MMGGRVTMLYSLRFEPHEGWYRRAYNQARTLIDQGCEVTLLAWDRTCKSVSCENLGGLHIHRFQIPGGISRGPSNAPNHLRFNMAVYRHLRRNPGDVVHAFNVATMPVALAAARRAGCSTVADICEPDNFLGFWPKRYNQLVKIVDRVEKHLASKFDQVFVHNTHQVSRFREAGVERLVQVGSYPNRSLLCSRPRQCSDNRVVVGRLGSVYSNNGYEEIISGFRTLLSRRSTAADATSYRLRIAGNVFDNYAAEFDRLLEPLREHVDITGAYDVSELVSLYQQIDVSLLLYGKEAFGNVTPTKLFESMACGVPVVVSNTGDMPEVVRDADCGVVVDAEDPTSICEGIEKIAANPERLKQMSANAIRAADEKYTWEAVQEEFISAYRPLLS